MRKSLTGILLSLVSFAPVFAGIVFQKETVETRIISCDTLEVRGTYFLVNNDSSAAQTVILYPFPIDSSLSFPHFIDVVKMPGARPMKFARKSDGVTWKLSMKPHGTDIVRVTYRQKAARPQGRYIVTTTRAWGKPLESADFTVTAPPAITLEYWSFQYDSLLMKNGRIVYMSRQKRFYPDSDMLLRWNCGNK